MADEGKASETLSAGAEAVAGKVRGTLMDALQDAVLGAVQDGAVEVLAERHGGRAKELEEALKMPWEKTPAPQGDLLQRAKTSEELGLEDTAVTEGQVAEFEKMREEIG